MRLATALGCRLRPRSTRLTDTCRRYGLSEQQLKAVEDRLAELQPKLKSSADGAAPAAADMPSSLCVPDGGVPALLGAVWAQPTGLNLGRLGPAALSTHLRSCVHMYVAALDMAGKSREGKVAFLIHLHAKLQLAASKLAASQQPQEQRQQQQQRVASSAPAVLVAARPHSVRRRRAAAPAKRRNAATDTSDSDDEW